MLIHQIQKKIEQQIKLDQLTGNMAIKLRAAIKTVEDSEKRLKIAKAAVITGCLLPPSCAALKNAYEIQKRIENQIQDFANATWETERLKWSVYRPFFSQKSNLPKLSRIRIEKSIDIKIKESQLISTSRVWQSKGEHLNEWKIAWVE